MFYTKSCINQVGGTRPCSFLHKKRYTVRGHTNSYIKTVHTKSYINLVGGTRPSYRFLYLVYKRTLYRCRAALLRIAVCGARRLSIHNGVSIQICRRYWRRGQGEKNDRKKKSFSVSCFWGNRKTDIKKSGKKPTEENRVGFSVVFFF